MTSCEWLTRAEAAAYLKLKPKTLANLATLDRGPKFRKTSPRHVLYNIDELKDFVLNGGVH